MPGWVLWAIRALFVCGIAAATPARRDAAQLRRRDTESAAGSLQDLEFGVLVHFGTNTFRGLEWGDGPQSRRCSIPTLSTQSSG